MNAKVFIGIAVGLALILPALAQNLGYFKTAEHGAASIKNADVTQTGQTDLVITQTDAGPMNPSGMPTRGMSMEQVRKKFGVPVDRRSPVGDPPIARWEYQTFIVYFEYHHVIHSVAKR